MNWLLRRDEFVAWLWQNWIAETESIPVEEDERFDCSENDILAIDLGTGDL